MWRERGFHAAPRLRDDRPALLAIRPQWLSIKSRWFIARLCATRAYSLRDSRTRSTHTVAELSSITRRASQRLPHGRDARRDGIHIGAGWCRRRARCNRTLAEVIAIRFSTATGGRDDAAARFRFGNETRLLREIILLNAASIAFRVDRLLDEDLSGSCFSSVPKSKNSSGDARRRYDVSRCAKKATRRLVVFLEDVERD